MPAAFLDFFPNYAQIVPYVCMYLMYVIQQNQALDVMYLGKRD